MEACMDGKGIENVGDYAEWPMISVIMPVYNAHLYVGRAIQSILDQTYQNFELLLIDDGATDGSGEICDEYARKDGRITVVHQKNGGICNARNCGLRLAKGQYITFSDHDDEMAVNCLDAAMRAALETGAAVVKLSYQTDVYVDGALRSRAKVVFPNGESSMEELMRSYPLFRNALGPVWSSLYQGDLIRGQRLFFDEAFKFGQEDIVFNLHVLRYVASVAFASEFGYTHKVRREQSTSEVYNPARLRDVLTTAVEERRFLRNQGPLQGEVWVRHQDWYLKGYLYMLNRPACPMSRREKSEELRRLNSDGALGLQCKRTECVKLLLKSLQRGLLPCTYNLGLYGMTEWIYETWQFLKSKKKAATEREYLLDVQ